MEDPAIRTGLCARTDGAVRKAKAVGGCGGSARESEMRPDGTHRRQRQSIDCHDAVAADEHRQRVAADRLPIAHSPKRSSAR
jgi:hypothetical protein